MSLSEPVADFASPACIAGKLCAPYEYCGRISTLRLNRLLTLFLNLQATNQIYICRCIGAVRTRGASTGVLEMRRLIAEFLQDESGATAIEYCLIAAGISIVIVVAVNGMGTTLNTKFTSVNASIK